MAEVSDLSESLNVLLKSSKRISLLYVIYKHLEENSRAEIYGDKTGTSAVFPPDALPISILSFYCQSAF